LYPTEIHDLADKHPERLKEMIDLWYEEADKYNVLPLQGTVGSRVSFPRPMPGRATDKHVIFAGVPVLALVARERADIHPDGVMPIFGSCVLIKSTGV
jgi:hypothetical protein